MREELRAVLERTTENEIVEFKEAKNKYDTDKLGNYFSALSNEANLNQVDCGWLVFGIKEDKKNSRTEIVGTNISDDQINRYKLNISEHSTMNLTFMNVYRETIDGKDLLLFQIPPAHKGYPTSWKGHNYARAGESLTALSPEKRKRIESQSVSEDWSAQTIEDATIDDLSVEALKVARELYIKKNPEKETEIKDWDDKTFLNKAKITIRGKITNAAILLLGKSESEHFISPAVAKISWILKDRDNIENDYEHFSCPFLLNIAKVYAKVRNLKYRYMQEGTLFPEEVIQFDPYIIREALNNCIAHQDYSLGGKINFVESEESTLTFSNVGNFIPESVEDVVKADAPESRYRNPFLSQAMVNLNMIDTIGSGIRKMFIIQKNKYFPLPDYSFKNNSVKVVISGKVLNIDYARKLAQIPDMILDDIILLDKVQKHKPLSGEEIKDLRAKKLVEGRKPNFYISAKVAGRTDQMTDYVRMRGFKDVHYKKMILEFIDKKGSATKQDIEKLILDLLPEILDEKQRQNKLRNLVYAMSKKDKTIINLGTVRNAKWIKSSSKIE
ncbi:MAG: putative DNA binding domain-containing protein [Candidatus Kapabacteria bacterium]|jgi:ATP-dependent DNA helicase RecG|nr:putative DNA binding domain-containing protein [Candidatus Kapabacteria bacterium]